MIILKSYYDSLKNPGDKSPRDILETYGDQLEAAGWRYCIGEGGYISPDATVLFIVARDPYNGQLLCNAFEKESLFQSYQEEMVEKGIFVDTQKFEKEISLPREEAKATLAEKGGEE